MSASLVFSSAALGRPFIFSPPAFSPTGAKNSGVPLIARKTPAEILAHVEATAKLSTVRPASRLEVRPSPEMVSSGIPQLDALTGGLARGCLTEICGTASSGRTGILLCALASATRRGEACALVDANDAFDPASAAAAGMEMSRLLWVRCGGKTPPRNCSSAMRSGRNTEDAVTLRGPDPARRPAENQSGFRRWESPLAQMLKVTDLLLQSHGFGMIALDLGDVPLQSARRIPLASWFRFRRAIEQTPTVLVVLERQPVAGSSSSVLLRASGGYAQVAEKTRRAGALSHAELLDRCEITIEVLRSRLEKAAERKPVQSTASFRSRAAWAG